MKNIQKITGFASILFALSFMFQIPYVEAQSEGSGSYLCMPPTMGLLSGKSFVEGGFTINGQTHDVKYFDQDIPLTSFKTGDQNEIVLKIHEDSGSNNVVHVGLGIVTPHEISPKLTEVKSIIEWDKDHEGVETTEVFDSDNMLQDVTADAVVDPEAGLTTLTISFEASEQLEPTALKVTTWDRKLCSWTNTFEFITVDSSETLEPVYTTIKYDTASSTESMDSEHMTKMSELTSPLEQVQSGVSPNNVECKSEMVLILNNNDGRPACVSDSGADKLESLEWGIRA